MVPIVFGVLTVIFSCTRAETLPCAINELCQCSNDSETSNVLTSVTCLDMKEFPKFNTTGDIIKILRNLIITGPVNVIPLDSLSVFERVENLVIDRSSSGNQAVTSQQVGQNILGNTTIDSLRLINFPEILPSDNDPSLAKDTLSRLSELSLENSTVMLNKNLLKGADSLKRLFLRHNNIKTIGPTNRPFVDVAETLVVLDLSYNFLTHYPKAALEVLINLESLHVDHNRLASATQLNISSFPNLTSLDISRNADLLEFEPSISDHSSSKLAELHLDECNLQALPVNALSKLHSLQTFTAAHNNITVLQAKAFKNNIMLSNLILDSNPVQVIETGAFAGLKSLIDLSISEWHIESLDLALFESSSLTKLTIADNERLRYLSVSNAAVPQLNNLTRIEIRNNRLTEIDKSIEQLLDSNDQLIIEISNETNFDCRRTEHGNVSALMWLAELVACENGTSRRVHFAADFLCATDSEDANATAVKVLDFLISLHPNCTETHEGHTHSTASPTSSNGSDTSERVTTTTRSATRKTTRRPKNGSVLSKMAANSVIIILSSAFVWALNQL